MQKDARKIGKKPAALAAASNIWGAISQEERDLVSEALSTLLAERSRAFRIARDLAVARRREPPTVEDFALSHILRLQRAVADSNGG
jgi:hypothetical protein